VPRNCFKYEKRIKSWIKTTTGNGLIHFFNFKFQISVHRKVQVKNVWDSGFSVAPDEVFSDHPEGGTPGVGRRSRRCCNCPQPSPGNQPTLKTQRNLFTFCVENQYLLDLTLGIWIRHNCCPQNSTLVHGFNFKSKQQLNGCFILSNTFWKNIF
jgi:hypothetical protein